MQEFYLYLQFTMANFSPWTQALISIPSPWFLLLYLVLFWLVFYLVQGPAQQLLLQLLPKMSGQKQIPAELAKDGYALALIDSPVECAEMVERLLYSLQAQKRVWATKWPSGPLAIKLTHKSQSEPSHPWEQKLLALIRQSPDETPEFLAKKLSLQGYDDWCRNAELRLVRAGLLVSRSATLLVQLFRLLAFGIVWQLGHVRYVSYEGYGRSAGFLLALLWILGFLSVRELFSNLPRRTPAGQSFLVSCRDGLRWAWEPIGLRAIDDPQVISMATALMGHTLFIDKYVFSELNNHYHPWSSES